MDKEDGGEQRLPKWALSAVEVKELARYIRDVLSDAS